MRVQPRFGSDPIIRLDGSPIAVREPFVRQRRRLLATFASLTPEQWSTPSRCVGWTVREVAAHLAAVDTFWGYSISKGSKGQPTQILVDFDPTSTPAALVAANAELSFIEVLAQLTATTQRLLTLVESLEEAAWTLPAEGPPGHLSISAIVHHALWDAWIHERDVMLPLGQTPPIYDDEVLASLRYVAALGAGFTISSGTSKTGRLGVSVTHPDAAFVVDITDSVTVRARQVPSDAELSGDAVELLEALSVRAPLLQELPGDLAWMVEGLSQAFA